MLYRGSSVECVVWLALLVRGWNEEGYGIFLIFYSWGFPLRNTLTVINVCSLVVLRNTQIFSIVCNPFLFTTSLVSHTQCQIWYSVPTDFVTKLVTFITFVSVWGGFLLQWARICIRIVFIRLKYSYIKTHRKFVGPRKRFHLTEISLFWCSVKQDFTEQAKWVPGCMCNVGNGVADYLPRPASKQLLVGPELTCCISTRIVKWLAKDCQNRDYQKH